MHKLPHTLTLAEGKYHKKQGMEMEEIWLPKILLFF